jgi:serine/threonine protein phosphatase PrpC
MGLQDKVEKLIHTANENGGPDNITAVLLEFGDED